MALMPPLIKAYAIPFAKPVPVAVLVARSLVLTYQPCSRSCRRGLRRLLGCQAGFMLSRTHPPDPAPNWRMASPEGRRSRVVEAFLEAAFSAT